MAYYKNKAKHKDPPYPTEAEAGQYVQPILRSKYLRETVKEKKDWMDNPDKTPGDFIADYMATEKKVIMEENELKRYATPARGWKLRRERLLAIGSRLAYTGTGSYTGMEIISRKKNSTKFDDVKNAIADITAADENTPPSAKDIRESVNTVITYLEGKEKKRSTPYGRHRWTDCMRYLAEMMPREDFEAYCDHVNQVRGVEPGHEDYVGPESFYPANVNAKYVMNDSINRITYNKATLRDYARVLAVHNIAKDQYDEYQSNMPVNTDIMRNRICIETEKNNAADFNMVWESYKAQNPVAEQHAAKAVGTQVRSAQPGVTVLK